MQAIAAILCYRKLQLCYKSHEAVGLYFCNLMFVLNHFVLTEKIYAAKSSFFVGFRTTPSPVPPKGSTAKPSDQPNPGGKSKIKTKGVSSGAAAGISFLMLAVGIGGGLLIAHFIMKRRGTSLFSYQRQE